MDIQDSLSPELVLSEEAYNGIDKILDELLAKTQAEMTVFCEANGYPVVHKGGVQGLDLQAISALAANNFSATARMATMIGERDSFKFLFHEGARNNIYLSSVGFNFVLFVIFRVNVTLGMVRIFTKKAIEGLTELLKSAKEEEDESRNFVDLEFKSLLGEELDRSLDI